MIRTLIYAMQSSGASYYAFCLGMDAMKRHRVLCIPDLWHPFLAPSFNGVDVDEIILKVVVTNRYTLGQHCNSFMPDQVFLVNRHLEDNRRSLASKSYANESGDMDFKFSLFEAEWESYNYTGIIYEELIARTVTQSDISEMLKNNSSISPWAKDHFGLQWGFGGLRPSA